MTNSADEADYVFLGSDRGLTVCAECGEEGEAIGTLRFCRRCDVWESPETVGSIRAVLRRLPATHPLLKQFEVGLAGLVAEHVAVAIWDDIAAQEKKRKSNRLKEVHMNNTSSKSERNSLAGSSTATTYHQQASAQIALEGTGRFALSNDRSAQPAVSGSEPLVRYPGGAAWTRDPHPTEPPLGVSVEAMEACGEPHEVAASVAATAVAHPADAGGDVARAGMLPPHAPEPAPPSPQVASDEAALVVHPAGAGLGGEDVARALETEPASPPSAAAAVRTNASRNCCHELQR